jgi:ribonuclease D
VYLIDPLTVDDWRPLVDVLERESTTIVMHACGEDLELMCHHLNAAPTRLFDTQLAHAFVSTDFALSYSNLVRFHLNAELGKPQTRSDWRRRPLTEAQIRYACEDVEHLPQLHRQLADQLESLGRYHWFEETMLVQGRYTPGDPERYYLGMRKAWRFPGEDLAVLRSLTSWRERTAMTENVPRNRVVWDEHLLAFSRELVLQERVVWDLLPKPVARRYAPDIVEVHRSGRSAEPLPRLEPPLTQSQGQVSNKLREVARAEADSYAMSAELLARKREVEHCIRHFARTGELSPGYSGWREELVGDRFRRILAKLR